MRIEIDPHTHTVLSGHAHSTLLENARSAKEKGLKGFVITEHGPLIVGAPPAINIPTYDLFPPEIEGVRAYHGIEANIITYDGKIDLEKKYLEKLDFVIASLHSITIKPGTKEQNTSAMIGALSNKYIDAIGHPGNAHYEIDRFEVVKTAKEQNKLLEVNNRSFVFRKGSNVGCAEIIKLCKQLKTRIIVSSDTHFCYEVGAFEYCIKALKECDFPEELIVNATKERFEEYLAERAARIGK